MADLLSQKEIDDLLNSSISDDTPDAGGSDDAGGPEKTSTSRSKTFSYKENKNVRFAFVYHSPVLKKDTCVYNPEPAMEESEGVHIVRNLDNYVEYLKHRKVGA